MRLLFIDLEKKKSLPISHPISILNKVQKALLHLNLQTESTRKRKEHCYKGHTTFFAYNYLRRKLMSDMCYGVFGGHIVKLNLSLANCRAFLQALILRTGCSLNVTLHKSVLLH
jgi:hypothetical protein